MSSATSRKTQRSRMQPFERAHQIRCGPRRPGLGQVADGHHRQEQPAPRQPVVGVGGQGGDDEEQRIGGQQGHGYHGLADALDMETPQDFSHRVTPPGHAPHPARAWPVPAARPGPAAACSSAGGDGGRCGRRPPPRRPRRPRADRFAVGQRAATRAPASCRQRLARYQALRLARSPKHMANLPLLSGSFTYYFQVRNDFFRLGPLRPGASEPGSGQAGRARHPRPHRRRRGTGGPGWPPWGMVVYQGTGRVTGWFRMT